MRKRISGVRESSTPNSEQNRRPRVVLEEIHNKVADARVLNGGFDTLLFKIDRIEEGQAQQSAKLDKIHDAIYNSTDGLFTRIAESKLETAKNFGTVVSSVVELNEWKKSASKEQEETSTAVEESQAKIETMEKNVDGLVKSKNTSWAIIKWAGVAIGGGVVALLFKYLETRMFH